MKNVLKAFACIMFITIIVVNVFAVQDPGYSENLVPGALKTKTKNIWATVEVIVQIVSVACVVFAGLRYMFASGDQKADIKQGLTYLTIGAVLVFGATLIIDLVVKGFNEVR